MSALGCCADSSRTPREVREVPNTTFELQQITLYSHRCLSINSGVIAHVANAMSYAHYVQASHRLINYSADQVSDAQAEGSMTWMIALVAFNGTLFQPLNHLPTFQSV